VKNLWCVYGKPNHLPHLAASSSSFS
jgi:hypothetical protein